jgi:hypothetical protein
MAHEWIVFVRAEIHLSLSTRREIPRIRGLLPTLSRLVPLDPMHSYVEWVVFPGVPSRLVWVTHQITVWQAEQDGGQLNQRSNDSFTEQSKEIPCLS